MLCPIPPDDKVMDLSIGASVPMCCVISARSLSLPDNERKDGVSSDKQWLVKMYYPDKASQKKGKNLKMTSKGHVFIQDSNW